MDGLRYPCVDGIWRFLPAPLSDRYDDLIKTYETVREAEGWGERNPEHYRSLPFTYHTDRYRSIWRVRVQSYRTLMRRIVRPLTHKLGRALRVLDLGAGTGWLSYRLAEAGHMAAAVDLVTNSWDGLGAWVHFGPRAAYAPVQASFDHIPFTANDCDMIVFNGAVHYSANYEVTLQEALRVLEPHGRILIMDSPFYSDASSGALMVEQRTEQFNQDYGVEAAGLVAENFLTRSRLAELGSTLGITWQLIRPYRGAWGIRWMINRFRMGREPAQFPLIVGRL